MLLQLDPAGPGGRLPENVMHFARLLRGAGLRVGPDRVIDCVEALSIAGARSASFGREDWYWTMSAVLLSREEQRPIFDQAFRLFWRDPKLTEKMMQLLLPKTYGRTPKPEEQQSQRLTDALFGQQKPETREREEQRIELDARLTFSAREVLQRMDFDTMSAAELAEAKKMLRELRLPLPMVRTRRLAPHLRGERVHLRATLREHLREGGDLIPLVRSRPLEVHPPLVVLCDISGSMNPYARMFLHFLHAITNDRDRVHTFVFGTRLTNVTRQLRHRDVDVAMARVAEAIKDWSGGTRIGACLREFNWRWARRVLGQNACVLLVSDGLDREAGEGLGEEMERLAKSSRTLIWLNPLLRYERFEAKPAGVRAMLPHVDQFLPVHNLKSLVELARTLSRPPARHTEKRAWR
jgi:uncharacterized protein with von Willebrand factor type A (vWA) domain